MAKIVIKGTFRLAVNFVSDDKKRFVGSTGSYLDKDGNRVFLGSMTVFLGDKYTGPVPEKGDLVEVWGDATVQPYKDELSASLNVGTNSQVTPKGKLEKKAAAPAGAGSDDI